MFVQVTSRAISFLMTAHFVGLICTLTLPDYASSSEEKSLLPSRTTELSVLPSHTVTCFNPYSTRLVQADVEDCDFTINEIILRLPNPMEEQTWGYSDYVDVDLRTHENEKWRFGRCVIFVSSPIKTQVDRFRVVDVASTASKIVRQCIVDQRYPIGGTAGIGLRQSGFFVGVGGMTPLTLANSTNLVLPSDNR